MAFKRKILFSISRFTDQSTAHNGKISAWSVRALQSGDCPRRSRWRDQQKALAGNYQGSSFAVEHNFRCLHIAHSVSKLHSLCNYSPYHFFQLIIEILVRIMIYNKRIKELNSSVKKISWVFLSLSLFFCKRVRSKSKKIFLSFDARWKKQWRNHFQIQFFFVISFFANLAFVLRRLQSQNNWNSHWCITDIIKLHYIIVVILPPCPRGLNHFYILRHDIQPEKLPAYFKWEHFFLWIIYYSWIEIKKFESTHVKKSVKTWYTDL